MKSLLKSIIYYLLMPFIKRRMPGKFVYLTFDDGPHPVNTPAILKALKTMQTKATFFMLGKEMEKYPEIVRSLIAQGHTLGYHSYQHISLKRKNSKKIKKDIEHLRRLSSLFNYPIKLYRPPFGDLTFAGLFWFIFAGCKIIMWSKDSRDSFEELSQVLQVVSANNISGGEIILFHDDYNNAEALILKLLKEYKNNNIQCISI